ncbi:unnamed protein product [Peronospora destructor]|uniref:Uncharacterized protein n=1 Tax=Peronospora destructor TaxID=86335 RepID=A0AAV0TU67_9STRA|nr:unnamed protein product [Peronospora destructor]CAI5726270.1 unnamed protein product [Peronospora destructor]
MITFHFSTYRQNPIFLMKTSAVLAALGVCLAMAVAGKTTTFTDDVKPFPQPVNPEGSVLTAIKYKPSLNIAEDECSSYPAVDEHGVTSNGVPKGVDCFIPDKDSQVYTRGCWHDKVWAQMYAWYFPFDGISTWQNVVLFLNNPTANKQVILAVSFSSADKDDGYDSQKPPREAFVKGSTTKFMYANERLFLDENSPIRLQPLITWELLTSKAKIALNDPFSFGGAQAPFNEHKFEQNIEKAWHAANLPVAATDYVAVVETLP